MKGLSAIEWDVLAGAALPDPCNEDVECGDNDAAQDAAEDSLLARGLIVRVPCVFDPTDEHPTPTALGAVLLRAGRAAVVTSP